LARGNALVLDKWFAIQALAPEAADGSGSHALVQARALLKHPDFSLKNPNRARSLIFALCMGNPAAFHRADASGYVFWAEQLLALDAMNPQVAARLARAMDRWSVLAEPWRGAAREAIARVAASRPEPRRARDRHPRPGGILMQRRISLTQFLVEQQREHGRIPASCAC
jgi:aminopeptidase N